MKFFIDENLPPSLTQPLRELFLRHEFFSFIDEGLGGALDIPLFEELQQRGFDAIITKDTGQVGRNDAERRALHDRKIHWVGVAQPKARGLHLIATWSANIMAALPHVLAKTTEDAQDPSWFAIKGVKIEASQRMNSGPLWRPRWGQP